MQQPPLVIERPVDAPALTGCALCGFGMAFCDEQVRLCQSPDVAQITDGRKMMSDRSLKVIATRSNLLAP
jgi:hypothetical protein